MGSKVFPQQAPVQWLKEITKAKLNPFYTHLFIKTMKKEGKREIWTILGKLGQGNKLEKWEEKAERIRKGNKNLSGDGEEEEGEGEEGGESRV